MCTYVCSLSKLSKQNTKDGKDGIKDFNDCHGFTYMYVHV